LTQASGTLAQEDVCEEAGSGDSQLEGEQAKSQDDAG